MQVDEILIFGKTGEFRYSTTITNSPLVALPIKMQDLGSLREFRSKEVAEGTRA